MYTVKPRGQVSSVINSTKESYEAANEEYKKRFFIKEKITVNKKGEEKKEEIYLFNGVDNSNRHLHRIANTAILHIGKDRFIAGKHIN